MDKKSPRHSAGSFELKEGTGAITAMCPCGDFLELYKVDKTFRVRSPEAIDPEETNPNAPWVSSPVSDVGSSNSIVARVLLQGHEMLKAVAFSGEVNKEAVTQQLHACKEALLACERVLDVVVGQVDSIIADIQAKGISKDNHGRGLNPFPQVANLDADCGSFLIQANRAIKLICELPQFFITLDRADSNFEHLSNRLKGKLGAENPLALFVEQYATTVRYLIDLRNFHEHPKATKTLIQNFRVLPSGEIAAPTWQLAGEGVADATPHSIKDDMSGALSFLVGTAEAMLIHLVMYKVSPNFPYIVEEIADEELNKELPIKFRLTLDVSQLKFAQ